MYKVFFNDRVVNIIAEKEQKSEVFTGQSVKSDNDILLNQSINYFLKSDIKILNLISDNINDLWKSFSDYFNIVYAAGGVVRKENNILFIFKRGRWDLPKGKIEKDESPENAAIREVEEECGIHNFKIVNNLPSSYHIYKSPYTKSSEEWILKKTYWYEMEYQGIESLKPQKDENIEKVEWIKYQDLDNIIGKTYANLVSIINQIK